MACGGGGGTFFFAAGKLLGHVEVGLDRLVLLYGRLGLVGLGVFHRHHLGPDAVAAAQRARRQFLLLLARKKKPRPKRAENKRQTKTKNENTNQRIVKGPASRGETENEAMLRWEFFSFFCRLCGGGATVATDAGVFFLFVFKCWFRFCFFFSAGPCGQRSPWTLPCSCSSTRLHPKWPQQWPSFVFF